MSSAPRVALVNGAGRGIGQADLIEFIDTGALDGLSGRYIHAARDDWRALPGRISEILEADRMSQRVRS